MLLTQRIYTLIYIYSVNLFAQMLMIIFNQNVIYKTSISFHKWKKNKQDVNSAIRWGNSILVFRAISVFQGKICLFMAWFSTD